MYKTANIKTNNRRENTTGSGKEVSIPLSRWRERHRLVVMRFFKPINTATVGGHSILPGRQLEAGQPAMCGEMKASCD